MLGYEMAFRKRPATRCSDCVSENPGEDVDVGVRDLVLAVRFSNIIANTDGVSCLLLASAHTDSGRFAAVRILFRFSAATTLVYTSSGHALVGGRASALGRAR
jgi:hypothetical protein